MVLTTYQKRILLIIFIFVFIRIPVILIPVKVELTNHIIVGLQNGLTLYCDFEKFPYSAFWEVHLFPPGTYIYIILISYLFNNFALLIFELINMGLIYKIIRRYYGKDNAINALIFIVFFPISIINTGFTVDPFQISLIFILLGLLLFFNQHPVLSSISLAIGTLIIYIPAIIIIPIIIYYLKSESHNISNIISYLSIFILVLILGSLPFLLSCPQTFISDILYSLNESHSANYLNFDEFVLTPLLNSNLLEFEFLNVPISIKSLNLIQIIGLFITIFLIYKKFDFNDERDLIISSIILISTVTILTFYIHYRFIYWIFMLSIIILSYNSVDLFKKHKIIILGISFFLISFIGTIIALQNLSPINNFLYWLTTAVIILIMTIGFLVFGLIIHKDHKLRGTNWGYNIIYSSILMLCYCFFQGNVQLYFTGMNIILFNIFFILLLSTTIGALLFFIRILLSDITQYGRSINQSKNHD